MERLNMNNHGYEEQRNFPKMKIKTNVTYKVKHSNGHHHGTTGDLSASGLYMQTDFQLKEGDEIELVLTPNNDQLPPYVAEGKVVRMTKDENEPNQFHVSLILTKTC